METTLKEKVGDLIHKLSTKDPSKYTVLIGFDGFVDEILHVVKTRKNANEFERMRSIREYGERILGAAGLSTNIEMVKVQQKLGGNGPILSNALGMYGVSTTCIGSMGYPTLNAVFQPMKEVATLVSISEPGLTDAVEFDDGKIIVGKHQALKNVNWDTIKEVVGIENLVRHIEESKLIGFENWTMLPHMSRIWESMQKEVLPKLSENKGKYLFFDLCDPEKRTDDDILEALNLIKKFSLHFQCILGLNFREAILIAQILGFDEYNPNHSKEVDLQKLVKRIAQTLEIYAVVVHPTSNAATVINGEYYEVTGPYTPTPKLTTGAGDNFNAGFCLGQILDLDPMESIVLGVATSGFYVRNAKSPSFNEILLFMKDWKDGKLTF